MKYDSLTLKFRNRLIIKKKSLIRNFIVSFYEIILFQCSENNYLDSAKPELEYGEAIKSLFN